MGGQACVLYGAAEFSRDTDLVILPDTDNLERLRRALHELQAHCIAVPPFEPQYLDMGLAVHFRCQHVDAPDLRIDVMTKLRGVSIFSELWDRRTTFEISGETVEVLGLSDLVQAKKTQRDKDWPMIARLLEADYFHHRDAPSQKQVEFWLRELRTPSLLIDVATQFASECQRLAAERSLLTCAASDDESQLRDALEDEQRREREADRQYWLPLRAELERLRRRNHPMD